MREIKIEHTKTTPKVIFNKETGIFIIEGKTLPENTHKFYEPLLDWLTNYINNPNEETILKVKLEYINTASSKSIFSIFLKLEKLIQNGKKANIEWFFSDNDDDMKSVGQEYAILIKVPFKHIEFETEN